jgi:hypothetical protein
MRVRRAVSTTRAPSLSRCRLRVVNSALASGLAEFAAAFLTGSETLAKPLILLADKAPTRGRSLRRHPAARFVGLRNT